MAEVLAPREGVGGQDPDLDELCEVPEVVQAREPLDAVRRQRIVVAARDLEQRLRPHGALEVDVELDLGVRHEACVVASSRPERRRNGTERQRESYERN